MKILIIGAGRIGANLARALSKEEHEVYVVENNESIARKANEKLDVKVINGSGTDPKVLKEINIQNVDLVIAVTVSDETNLLAGALTSVLGAKKVIARIRNKELAKTIKQAGYQTFNIDDIINPEDLAADEIVKAIHTPGTSDLGDFADGKILLRAFDIPQESPIKGLQISDCHDEDFPWPFLIVAISRNGEVVIPKGSDTIELKDRIYVLLPAQSVGEFLSFINPGIKQPTKAIIYGATDIGERVAMLLSKSVPDLLLVEENKAKAEAIASRLENVRIINGSMSEQEVMKECGVEAADVFVATTKNDHANLISALLAKKMGAKYAIITTDQPDYVAITDALDIDVIINPHLLAVEQILGLVRGKGIQYVTKLLKIEAEALELVPAEEAIITRTILSQIKFPKNSIVGAICRGTEVFLAKGDTQIMAGDKVIVFCKKEVVTKLTGLFLSPNKAS